MAAPHLRVRRVADELLILRASYAFAMIEPTSNRGQRHWGIQTMRGEGARVRTRGYALSGAMRLYVNGPAVLNPHFGIRKPGRFSVCH